MQTMYINKNNWSENDMKAYHYLAKKYYPNRKENGYFIDCGANIGTTCIYFKKELDDKIKILAFEPLKENYDFFRINSILNGIEKDIIIEKLALSNESCKMNIHKNEINPGGTGFFDDKGQGDEIVDLVSLDDYFVQHNLEADDLKYMWIDTEGFEPQVLEGARSLLTSGNIPLYMEFNPYKYKINKTYENFVNLIETIYKKVIFIPEIIKGNEILHSVSELWNFKDKDEKFLMDIFFIQ